MKRNMELVRAILEAVEETPAYHKPSFAELLGHSADGGREAPVRCERNEVDAHLELLIDGGLLEGSVTRTIGATRGTTITVSRLTWKGYDYLDALRNPPTFGHLIEAPAQLSAAEITREVVRHIDKVRDRTLGPNATRAAALERV